MSLREPNESQIANKLVGQIIGFAGDDSVRVLRLHSKKTVKRTSAATGLQFTPVNATRRASSSAKAAARRRTTKPLLAAAASSGAPGRVAVDLKAMRRCGKASRSATALVRREQWHRRVPSRVVSPPLGARNCAQMRTASRGDERHTGVALPVLRAVRRAEERRARIYQGGPRLAQDGRWSLRRRPRGAPREFLGENRRADIESGAKRKPSENRNPSTWANGDTATTSNRPTTNPDGAACGRRRAAPTSRPRRRRTRPPTARGRRRPRRRSARSS
jgi:hypothetical protein